MPIAAFEVAIVLGSHKRLYERPAVVEEILDFLPLGPGSVAKHGNLFAAVQPEAKRLSVVSIEATVAGKIAVGLGIGLDGGVAGPISLWHVFFAIEKSDWVVVQYTPVDEYVLVFADCSEKEWNGHGPSDGFRDGHVRGGIARVNLA